MTLVCTLCVRFWCVRLAGRQECALIQALRVLTNVCVTKATINCGYIAEKIRISVECV